VNHSANLANEHARSGAALFGKIPARADFVRERCTDRAAQRFDQWLIKAIETMQAARASLPPVMVRFAFCAEEERSLLVGVLSPSKDQVGRDFPISVFCSVPLAQAESLLCGLPLAYGAFLSAAEDLIREIPALSAEEVVARLDQLPAPDPHSLSLGAARVSEALRAADARELAARTLGDPDGAGPAYGYYTFVTAARNASAGSPTVLDCPIQIDVDLFAWLALAERLMRGRGTAPSFFWTEEPSARLLLALGSCSAQVLQFMADPATTSARLWPLVTTRGEVAEQVRASFAPNILALQPGSAASIEQLIEGLARRGMP
jgi:type VI secretion system protein ImpM